jgi:hypothetical protein
MAANDGSTNVPIQVEFVPDSVDPASRVPGAIAAAAIAPGVVAAFFAADDGERSVYNNSAALRAGDSGQTYTGAAEPAPEVDYAGAFDTGGAGADGGGE